MADRRRTRGVKREKKDRNDLGSFYELGVTRDQMQAVSDIHALVDGNTPKSFARNVKSAAKEREEKRLEDGLMKSYFALSAAQGRAKNNAII